MGKFLANPEKLNVLPAEEVLKFAAEIKGNQLKEGTQRVMHSISTIVIPKFQQICKSACQRMTS